MTELSGTLEGVGLPATVRFLNGLKKTGCLRVVYNDWRGEIFFEIGRVTGATLGTRQGLSALDALVQALPGGSFTFDSASERPAAGEVNIALSAEALQAHLDDLANQTAGTPRLPALDSVPVVLGQDSSSSAEEPLPLDRGSLQTLLSVDGRRTVQDIVVQRGSLDVLWHLANLVEVGLLRISPAGTAAPAEVMPAPPQVAPAEVMPAPLQTATEAAHVEPSAVVPERVEPIGREPEPAEPSAAVPEPVVPPIARPFAIETVAVEEGAHCPKLGFEDDPTSSFSRPTRMHRCFAAGTPLPLSLDQQRELCLTDQFGTCPRLTMGGFVPPARDGQSAQDMLSVRRPGPGSRRPEPEGDDPRIVRLPFAARSSAAERGAVADRQAVGGVGPTRFRTAGGPAPESPSTPPTPLRARLERTNGPVSDSAVAKPPTAFTQDPLANEPKPVDKVLVGQPGERRLGGVRLGVIAGGSVIVVALAIIVYLVSPNLGNSFVDDSLDTSMLPNTSAVVAGTPVTQLTAARATSIARATAVAARTGFAAVAPDGSDGATAKVDPNVAGAASAASASTAAPAPTLPPEPAQAAPQAAPAKPAGAAQPAAAPAGAAQPATGPSGAAPPAASTLFDERFTNNDRNWPSTAQGTAFVTNGSYRLATRQSGQFVAVGAPIADTLGDVVVNATFHKLSGPPGGGYGIIVRDQARAPQNGTSLDGHYYVLEVGDKGEVGMWRRDGDHWVDLLPWQPSAAAKSDTASNELSVRAVGNRLSLTVNGTLVGAKTDDTFAAGGVGLFVGGDGNQVAVDRFSIQTP